MRLFPFIFMTMSFFAGMISRAEAAVDVFPDGSPVPGWFSDSSKVDFSTLGKKYVLTDYGVKNDPSIVQTEAIQRVIDLAASQGGGVIVVPEGVFKSGALRFRGGTHLYVEGTLKGSDRVVDFPLEPTRIEGQNCMYFPALVNVENVNGFALGGPGVIDGSGYHFWEEMQIRLFMPEYWNQNVFPLLITMKGSFNDALRDFPWTIAINLLVSLFLAVMVIPFLEVLLIKPETEEEKQRKKQKRNITDVVQNIYDNVLRHTFRHPWLTIFGGIGVILLSLLIVPTLKVRLFPYADRNQFAIEIFLPEGKGINETRQLADSMRLALKDDKRVRCITSFVGCSSPRFMTCYAPQMAGRNYAQFIVNTTSQDATLELLAEYQPMWSEKFPNAYVRFKRLDFLEVPELEYRFYGENLDSLHTVAEQLMARMREMPELEWVHTDFLQPYPIVDVTLDPVATAQLGISRSTAALALSATSGKLRIGQLWEGNYEVPIVVKDDADLTYSDIEDFGIASPMAVLSSALPPMLGNHSTTKTVPLRQIAQVKPAWSESRIMHRGGERCLTVTAQFAHGTYAAPIESRVADLMKEMPLPQGVRSEVGGEIEYDLESLPQIFGGVGISMVIIFFFLLFNFRKYGITIVCIAALGLMLPGALVGLGLMNRTLGLTSIMGVITLMGMIMRNAILIFEHANNLMKQYKSEHPVFDRDSYNAAVKQAAIDAGSRRMVPIFLTTATTAVGVVPMIIAQSSFWMPVGVTIFAGGIGSLIMVVTMLPVVYWKVSTK